MTAFALVAGSLPCGLDAQAQQKVPLVLSRLAIELDSATYRDIRNSPFIQNQLAAADTGFLWGHEGGQGIRLIGKYNLLTLWAPAESGRATGDVGIVLAAERGGDLARLTVQGPFKPAPTLSVGSHHGMTNVDRFDYASDRVVPSGADALSDRVRFAITEFGDAMARVATGLDSLPEANRSNSRFLAPYFDPKKLLSHLTGATLAVPVDDIKKIGRVLTRDGITVVAEGEGAIIKLDGFTLHLIPSFVGAGVKQLQFALTRAAVGNPIYQFGPKSQLRFGPGPIAVWDFKWP